jgi:hypothetical protein
MFRWANYDALNAAVQLNVAEVPSAIAQFPNPIPANGLLPASLYLSGKPSWWGNAIPWPAIGPDVSGGDGPGGRSYRIPARVCYDNTPKSNGILNFNANNCYGSTTGPALPAPPANLRIVSGL